MDFCDTTPRKSSSFLKELQSLPLLQSAKDLYTSSRDCSRVLNTGLAVMEFTLSNVWENVFSKSELAARIDGFAGEGVSKLKERFPAINKSPDELKVRTSMSLKKTVRTVMKLPPGQMFIRSMDWALDKSESLLERITPRHLSPRKRKITRAAAKKAQITTDHAYASEDSGACEAEGSREKAHRAHLLLHNLDQAARSRQLLDHLGLMDKVYRLTVVLPLEIFVQTLKSFRRYVGGKRKKQALSPQKENEIEARRKISPRKKMPSSLLGKIRSRTYKLLGYQSLIPIDLSRALCKSPDRVEAEKKRKHDEILSDECSDSDDDLANFDYDNYESEEDPDYEPVSSEDSEDSDIEDEQDDLDASVETETLFCRDCEVKPPEHHHFVQLKDQSCDAKLIVDNKVDIKKTEKMAGTSVDKPDDDISLKPQWQK